MTVRDPQNCGIFDVAGCASNTVIAGPSLWTRDIPTATPISSFHYDPNTAEPATVFVTIVVAPSPSSTTVASSTSTTMPVTGFSITSNDPQHTPLTVSQWKFDNNAIISTVVGMFVCLVMIGGIFYHAWRDMKRIGWKGPEDNYKRKPEWMEEQQLEFNFPRELEGWELRYLGEL